MFQYQVISVCEYMKHLTVYQHNLLNFMPRIEKRLHRISIGDNPEVLIGSFSQHIINAILYLILTF